MEQLLRRYLKPGASFMDVGCGEGDGLVLAELCSARSSLWGIDIDLQSLKTASARVPSAKLLASRMPGLAVSGEFDVVHEFGMAYLIDDWAALARGYLSLARQGGVILWELPRKWSMAHLMFMASLAPRLHESEPTLRRLLRSLVPSKYTFRSDRAIHAFLDQTGCDYEIVEEVPIWYFYCGGPFRKVFDALHRLAGSALFERLDSLNRILWPRAAGYYLVLRKRSSVKSNRLP